jgi:hypothetical protein
MGDNTITKLPRPGRQMWSPGKTRGGGLPFEHFDYYRHNYEIITNNYII